MTSSCVEAKYPLRWERPGNCRSFWAWLYCRWRIRKAWQGPYVLLYEVGHRVLGFEFIHVEEIRED